MPAPRKLTRDCTLLGNHFLNTFLLSSGETHLLIEPGISSTAPIVLGQLESMGFDTHDISHILLTHAHADHVTGACALKARMPWVKVAASGPAMRLLQKQTVQNIFMRDDREISDRLKKLGREIFPVILDYNFETLIDLALKPGEPFTVGDISLEVIDSPGHCIGGASFWEPSQRLLFCSDYLGFFLPPDQAAPNFYVNLDDYLSTFDKLRRLEPDVLCPGHGGAFTGASIDTVLKASLAEIRLLQKSVEQARGDQQALNKLCADFTQKYHRGEAAMFTGAGMLFCTELMARRILERQ